MAKASVRDLATVVARGGHAATTVAATAHLAHRAGIRVFATGGLGGVHRDASTTFDESADLVTLGRTGITVVCAGVKSILDVGATLERLETLGVAVVGMGTDRFPGFYLTDSGFPVDARVDVRRRGGRDHGGATRARHRRRRARRGPPPPRGPAARPGPARRAPARRARGRGRRAGVRGKAVTPFLLEWFHRESGGDSLRANVAIIERNAELAARIAVADAR